MTIAKKGSFLSAFEEPHEIAAAADHVEPEEPSSVPDCPSWCFAEAIGLCVGRHPWVKRGVVCATHAWEGPGTPHHRGGMEGVLAIGARHALASPRHACLTPAAH